MGDARLDTEFIQTVLARRGWSAEELYRQCRALGYEGSSRNIQIIVAGRTANPGIVVVDYMARALGVRLETLILRD